jgi:cysteine sulfinate desulfinase/cysteine desulfurase-like protein
VSGSNEISHVLAAMGFPEDEAAGALRFSIGRTTTTDEIGDAGRLISATIRSHREAAERLDAQRAAALSRPVEAVAAAEATGE